jgi:hypothetical protein
MIEYCERKLDDGDIKYINKKYKSQEKYLLYTNEKILKYLPFYSITFMICTAVFFTLLYKKSDNFLLFFTGTIFILSPFKIFKLIKNFRKSSLLQGKIHQIMDDILEKDIARVIHCNSTKMIEFEEIEDEGAEYLFQVEENKIFHIKGQEFYETALFPSNNFELTSIMGKEGDSPTDFYIRCIGHKISPMMVITADIKKEYIDKVSELPEIIEGNIDDLDSIMDIILK